MKATLVDVHTVYREVELPLECPKCRADLTAGTNTIEAWEYQDQKRYGALDLASSHFEFDANEMGIPEGGESFHSYLGYHCGNCKQVLAEGGGDDAEVGDLPAGAEHARYPLDRWWEALRRNPNLRCSYEAWVAKCLVQDGVETQAPPTMPELPPS